MQVRTDVRITRPGAGWSSGSGRGFAGREAFDDPEREPLVVFDREARSQDGVVRAAQEVFAGLRHGDHLQETLRGAHRPAGSGDVVGEQEQAPGRSTRRISATARWSSGIAHRP